MRKVVFAAAFGALMMLGTANAQASELAAPTAIHEAAKPAEAKGLFARFSDPPGVCLSEAVAAAIQRATARRGFRARARAACSR